MYNEKVIENMDERKNIFAASVDWPVTVAFKEINLYLLNGSGENWQCCDDDANVVQ